MKVSLKVTVISALSVLVGISAMAVSAEETFHQGDVNGDNIVDAVDASLILSNYAAASTNQPLPLDEAQIELADTNGDGQADALDSTLVLGYYGYTATNGTMTPEEYYINASAKNNNDYVTEPPVEGVKPQQTSPQTAEPAPVAPVTTVKPQGVGVRTDDVTIDTPEPVYTEPVTPAPVEPETEPQTEPEIVHGEGCQYFHYDTVSYYFCEDGNDGYPEWYDDEDKENFKYAFNEALKYTTEFNAVAWGTAYVNCLRGRDKSEVFIGDPTDGEGTPNVWVLKGYNEDGDEIWYHGK